ncbi:N-lysine methyltransferase KMT5A-like [Trichosurus vulpecula]|uniref:N-lysine methyltransferase KMT5A-like n=1 Tax=Trichosurus vulpecula TaxID=9337 RepID=UPI00186AEBD8|nr:N-lysine methyltransferase KMT5A-like [Trichosurus vulpecula]
MKSKLQKGRAGRSSSSSRIIQSFLPRTRSQALRAQALAMAPPRDAATTSRGARTSTKSRRGAGPNKEVIRKLRSYKRLLKAKNMSQNHKVTDYFAVRRSTRKNRGELRTEARIRLNELIKSGKEEGMRVGIFDGKGRGVITTRPFRRGDYVVEYHGDLIDLAAAKKREARYAKNPATGCYMYYFHYRSKGYCVDATKETGRLGRLINHSKSGNCQTKLHPIDGVPHLIVIATRDIEVGEELLYDYGDRSKASLEAYPWLKH